MPSQQPQPRKVRIGISGSYGGLNLGDEAILQVIVSQFRRSLPVEVTVFSRNAEDTLARHDVERAVSARSLDQAALRAEVERLDLLILGGGGILFDKYVQLHFREVEVALESGISVMVYAVGAGPLRDPAAQEIVRTCLRQAAVVTVRDRDARQFLIEEVGIRRPIEVTADPALLLKPEPLQPDALARQGVNEGHRLVGISVRESGPAAPDLDEEHYQGLVATVADFMIDRFDADVVFVPMERRKLDLQQSHAVIAKMTYAERAAVLKDEYTPGQVLSLMSRFTFAVGMRLHFLLFAALQRVPFVALPYAGKVAGFLEELQLPSVPEKLLTGSRRVAGIGQLMAQIDRAWDLRHDLQAHIDRVLPGLQERACESHRLAMQLLTERPAGRSPNSSEVVS